MNAPNSNRTQRFNFQDGSSNKFWEITIDQCDVTVRFGRIGTQGQVQTKSFDSATEAQKHHDKLVAEKRKKGYLDEGSTATASPEPAKTPLVVEVSEASEAKALFNQWWNLATAEDTNDGESQQSAPEPTNERALTLENLAEASANGWSGTIASMFTGVSEPKRASMRKEFLKEHQIYGTLFTSETAPHWKKASHATKLIDIALGNKQELLYALNPAVLEFPAESIKILRERKADWLANAIERHLQANPMDSFPTWAELVSAGILTTDWDDRTIRMIGDSNFRCNAAAELTRYHERLPDLTKHLHRLLVSQTWAASDPHGMIAIINFMQEKGLLNRLQWIRTALHGHYQVGNQNHTRGCMAVLDHLAPSPEELQQCQGELAAVLEQSKPFVFESLFRLLDQLAKVNRIDWVIVGPALAGVFTRAGIAQAKSAIQILSAGAHTPDRTYQLQALGSALLHNKREISELAWKNLASLLTPKDEVALQHLQSLLPHVSENLRRQIQQHATMAANENSASESGFQEGISDSRIVAAEIAPLEIPQLNSFPSEIIETLKLREAVVSLEQQAYVPSASWNIMQAPALSIQMKLVPIESLDELILRLGAASHKGATVDERELLLDGICRFPRQTDPSFAIKVASIKKDADANDGFINAEWNADFAWLIRAWLGLERPEKPERAEQARMEGFSQHRSVAIENTVRRGNSLQLVSISTHTGGWIDPEVFLDRIERAEKEGEQLFLPDLELGILRLAPDGRTTHWRNPGLIERARVLKGKYALMIRYAMGESIPDNDMIGSQRLWVAAMKSREEERTISDQLPFSVVSMENGESCKLPATAVRELPKWHSAYATEKKAIEDGRGHRVNLVGGDLDRGLVYKPNIVSISENVPPSADNYFMTRFLAGQIFAGRFFQYIRRSYWPAQLDWYWHCMISSYMFYAINKTDFDFFDDIEPLLEPERPLTKGSARILWISSMTRAEKHRLWTTEAWAQIVDDDRLDIPLLMDVLFEFKDQTWIVPKRWSEVLTPVVSRSPLHAWDMAKLVLAMIQTFPFEAKDVAPLLEIVLEAYTWLGLSADASELEAMRRFATGKSKKAFEAISKLRFVESGDAAVARQSALQTRITKRFERAQRFSFSN